MSTAARRYAQALIELSPDIDSVLVQLNDLKDTFADDELMTVFGNPSVDSKAKHNVLSAIAKKLGLNEHVDNTLHLLADRGRLRELPEFVAAFTKLAEEQSGRVRAEVVSATKLSDAYYERLRGTLERVTGKKIILNVSQDPTLIGGVIARVGDQLYDGSLRSQLAQLQNNLQDE